MSAASSPRQSGVYLALILMNVVAAAGITVIYSMLPVLYRHFPESNSVGWVVTVYWLVSAIAAAICGRLGDLVGRRKVTVWVLMLCAGGAILSSVASSLPLLIAGCAMQGLAGALTPLSFGIVRENVPEKSIPLAVGILGSVVMVSAGMIYLASGAVIDGYSWQGGFWFKATLSVLAFVVVVLTVPHSTLQPSPKVAFISGLLFAPGLTALLIVVQKGAEWGWDTRSWLLFGLGLIILLYWGRSQWRQPVPLINLRLLTSRQVIGANLSMVCIGLGCLQLGQIMSLYLQQSAETGIGFGLSATHAGVVMLGINLFALIGGPLGGRIASRHGARSAAIIGLVIAASAWAGMWKWHGTLPLVACWAILSTVGYAFAYPAIFNAIIEATPASRTSEATGVTTVFFACSFAVGAQIIFTLLASDMAPQNVGGIPLPTDLAYARIFGYVVLTTLVGLMIALTLPRRSSPSNDPSWLPLQD